jgi:hypothetical protein
LIEAIHAASRRCVLALTGGGAEAAGHLLGVPGASRTVLEVVVPYHEQALVEYLGRRPAQFCSAATSQELATRALERAHQLAPRQPVLGLGLTASLATDRPKQGDHRFYLSLHSDESQITYALVLTKGARDRAGEEAVLDGVLLNALAEAVGVTDRISTDLLPGETVQVESRATDLLANFLRGEFAALSALPDGRLTPTGSPPTALVPGAFNPVHAGHWQLAEVARQRVGGAVAFELSVTNVDKLPLPAAEIRCRLHQFALRLPVWVTRAPTFPEKATLFPGVVFVVGSDTARRIVAPRYYQDSPAQMALALDHIRRQGCRFLVAGRADAQGQFVGLDDLALPAVHRDLFSGLSRAEFDVPVSSTTLRGQAEKPQAIAPPTAGQ